MVGQVFPTLAHSVYLVLILYPLLLSLYTHHSLPWVCVSQDITERKVCEFELRAISTEQKLFLDTAALPMIGIDNDGLVTEWNHVAREITGYSLQV